MPGGKDANGSLVIGLSRHPNGSYYATFTGPKYGSKRVYFGKAWPQALIRYREWEAIQTGKMVTLEDTERMADPLLAGIINKIEIEYLGDLPKNALVNATDAALGTRWNIPKQVFWAMFRRMMQDDIRGCAEASGYPLDRLHLYRAPEKPLTVEEVLAPFETKAKGFSRSGQLTEAKHAWKTFTSCLRHATIDKIEPTDLRKYSETLRTSGLSPRTIKNQIKAVRAIITEAWKTHRAHRAALIELKQELSINCPIPKQNAANPKPMSVAALKALLKAADVKWRAILITALNLALHAGDLAVLRKSDLKFGKGIADGFRSKNGLPRFAVLWPETIAAIRAWRATDDHGRNHTPYLFCNEFFGRLTTTTVCLGLKKLREEAGLGEEVVFDGLRDLFASETGDFVTGCKWVMGHRIKGELDQYKARRVEDTANAVNAVRKAVKKIL